MKLNEANLGRRKVVFPNKNAGHDEVKSILENECPKLKSGGGFLLLRAVGGGAGQRSLQVIQPGEKGYSIPYLRCTVCVGQAVTYVRPLQTDLNMDKKQNQVCGPLCNVHTTGVLLKVFHFRTTQPISCKSEQICNRSVKTCCQQADIWMRSLALYLSVLTGPQRPVNRSVTSCCDRAAAMLFSTGLSQVVDTELQQCCFQQLATDLLQTEESAL
jgi:hypothetical protein